MGLWSRISGVVARDSSDAANPARWFADWIRGGSETTSGEHVSPERALKQTAVWACVRVRSDDVGKLPLILYRRLVDKDGNPNGSKERAYDHPLFTLIRDRPNPIQTAFEFRQMLQSQKDLRGNGYAMKEFDVRGNLIALWPVMSEYVTVMQTPDGRELFYRIAVPGIPPMTIPAEGMFHLRGFSLDGKVGLSPVGQHRETIGMAIAAEKYGAAFFGNSAQPSGAIEVPSVLSAEAYKLLRDDWESKHKGSDNAKKIAIFDGGMKWQQIGMDNTDAQYLETRTFQNREIWRMYRMPPHKVGDLDRATNNNIEHQALEYVSDCLMPELVCWEQSLARDLLNDKERGNLFFEFMVDALLRGDQASRYAAYAIARNWGILSVNDIRDRENMNRIPDGDIYLQPLNMVEAGTPPPVPVAPAPPGGPQNLNPDAKKYLLQLAQSLVAADDAREQQSQTHEDDDAKN